jgi:hypothetical protein
MYSRAEVLTRPSPVPNMPGINGWYFRTLPGGIDASRCIEVHGGRLVYVVNRSSCSRAEQGDSALSTPQPLPRECRRIDIAAHARLPPRARAPTSRSGNRNNVRTRRVRPIWLDGP